MKLISIEIIQNILAMLFIIAISQQGSEICQGVPNAYLSLTEWADQRMKNVNKAI